MEEKKEDPLMASGKRTRKEVNYKEMSDSQAFKMFETGVDPNENGGDTTKRPKRQSAASNATMSSATPV